MENYYPAHSFKKLGQTVALFLGLDLLLLRELPTLLCIFPAQELPIKQLPEKIQTM